MFRLLQKILPNSLTGAATAVALFADPLAVEGRSFRVSQIPNGSVNSCANCHNNPSGGGSRNAFGQAVQAGLFGGNVDWNATLAGLDSDGDGFTNGVELQDPSGSWTSGSSGNVSLVSNPGSPSSVPPPTNSPPTLSHIGNRSVDEGSTLSFSLSASDPEGDEVAFWASGLPSGASLSGASFSWTPGFFQAGSYTLTITASDGDGGSDAETLSITVADVNRSPALGLIDNKTIAEGGTLSFSVVATDADSDTVEVAASDLPKGASFSDDLFAWSPDFSQAGTHTVTFSADDGKGGSDAATVEIVVDDVNRPPTLGTIGDHAVDEGDTLRFLLGADDPDKDAVAFSVDGAPAGATLDEGHFVWVPGFNQAGDYEVLFTASDGRDGLASETISVTVADRDPPAGPVSIDFNLAPGDQMQRQSGRAMAGQRYTLQLAVAGAPEISGWRLEIAFDPAQLSYRIGSFRPGDFAEVLEISDGVVDGLLTITATIAGGTVSGEGDLGVLSFDIRPGFDEETTLTVGEVEFVRADESTDTRVVRSAGSIVVLPVEEVLRGDFDATGRIDFDDFFLFAESFGTDDPRYDLDRNGIVGFDDFFIFADSFGLAADSGEI